MSAQYWREENTEPIKTNKLVNQDWTPDLPDTNLFTGINRVYPPPVLEEGTNVWNSDSDEEEFLINGTFGLDIDKTEDVQYTLCKLKDVINAVFQSADCPAVRAVIIPIYSVENDEEKGKLVSITIDLNN